MSPASGAGQGPCRVGQEPGVGLLLREGKLAQGPWTPPVPFPGPGSFGSKKAEVISEQLLWFLGSRPGSAPRHCFDLEQAVRLSPQSPALVLPQGQSLGNAEGEQALALGESLNSSFLHGGDVISLSLKDTKNLATKVPEGTKSPKQY